VRCLSDGGAVERKFYTAVSRSAPAWTIIDTPTLEVSQTTPEGRPGRPERRPTMSHQVSRVVVVAVALLVAVTAVSMAAGPKQYQFTGTVTEVDAKAKTISVDKAGDVWEFSMNGVKDAKVKKGDKVTVYYQMVAKKIESK
jgi:hypothetical protein